MRGSLGVQIGGQAVQMAIQLAAIPIFVSTWGIANYGVWLVLFTIPAYLTVGDLGLTHAGANIVVQKLSRGQRVRGVETFQALRAMVAMLSLAIAALALVALGVLFPHLLQFADKATGDKSLATAMLLVGHALAGLQIGIIYSGFRALDRFVPCGYAILGVFLCEAFVALGFVLLGFGLFAAACAYFTVRIAGLFALTMALKRTAPDFGQFRVPPLLTHFRELWRPASAGLALPVASATIAQGIVIAIAAGAGPAAVPLFTTMRTLARVPVQLAQIVSRAAMPVLTVADARGDAGRRSELVVMMILASGLILVPGTLAIITIGPAFVELWTLGEVSPTHLLALVIGISMFCNGCWQQIGDMLLAINRHGQYAFLYLILATALVGAAYPLSRTFGITGAAAALGVTDAIMLVWMAIVARRIGFLDSGKILASWKVMKNRAVAWLGAKA